MLPSNTTDVIIADHSPAPALASSSPVPCSICLDLVIDDGDMSIANLHCGHKFHLACIGSAFNAKGAMQCPNCRKVESGRWLFGDGSAHEVSETAAQDWMPYEGPHDLSYSRRPIGLPSRPFGGSSVHSSIEESEYPDAFANFLRYHSMVSEHITRPSSARSYISYLQPVEHVGDSNFHHPLNSHPAPHSTTHSTYIQHPRWGWNCHFPPYNAERYFINHGNLTLTGARRSTHAPVQPFYYTQQPVSRTRESSMANSQSRESNQIDHTTYHHEQPSEVTNIPSSTNGFRRSGGTSTLPMVLPAAPHQPHNPRAHGTQGMYVSATERNESSYVPIIRGSVHQR